MASSLLFFALPILAQEYIGPSPLRGFELEAQSRSKQMSINVQERRDRALVYNNRTMILVSQKVSQIKDINKQNASFKIIDELEYINLAWTNHFIEIMTGLDMALQKIRSRALKSEINGRDVSATVLAIDEAEKAISLARQEIADQAFESYIPDPAKISDLKLNNISQNALVSQFRLQFKNLRDDLFSDLTTLRDGPVKNARNSVNNALQVLQKIPAVNVDPIL